MTHHSELAADERVAVWQLVAGLLMPMVVYWIVRQSPIDQRAVVTTYVVLALAGIYLAVTALAEVTKQWWLVYPSYIADPQLGIHFGRARGPMLGSHTLGMYLAEGLLCLWMARRHCGRIGTLLTIVLLPLFLAALYVTYTRCVWISAGLCVLVVLGLSLSHRWRTIFVASTLAASLLVAVFQWENLVRMERESEGGGAKISEMSAKSRISFLYVSWKMFCDAPLLGVGYGQFQQAAKPYLADRSTSLLLEDIRNEPNHNTLLGVLTETGLVGFSLFMAMLIGWTIQSWRLWRNIAAPGWVREQGLVMLGTLTIYLSQALFSDLRFSPNAQNITFLLAGLTAGLAAGPLASPARVGEHPSLSQRALLWK
jgi:O-antigen ligase